MPTLLTPPFTPAGTVVGNVLDYLRARMVTPVPIPDRANGGEPTDGPACLFGAFRFDGNPVAAIDRGVAQRTDDTLGGRPFAVLGFSRATSRQTAATGEPVTQALPLALILCQPLRGAEFEDADADALDVAADFATLWLGSRFLNPAALGLLGLVVGDVEAGEIAGAAVNFRRVNLTAFRSLV